MHVKWFYRKPTLRYGRNESRAGYHVVVQRHVRVGGRSEAFNMPELPMGSFLLLDKALT